MSALTVKSCATCPLRDVDKEQELVTCAHPQGGGMEVTDYGDQGIDEAPEFCPLRGEALTIRLSARAM